MRLLLILSLSFSLAFLSACNEDEKQKSSGDKELVSLLSETTELQRDIKERRLFSKATKAEFQGLTGAVDDVKIALRRLDLNPDSKDAVIQLYRAIRTINGYPMSAIDFARITDFVARVGHLASRYGSKHNIDVADLNWIIFRYNFSNGELSPFGTSTKNGNWDVGYVRERHQATTRCSREDSWLISPTFDLSTVKNPALQIKHATTLSKSSRDPEAEFNRPQLIKDTFNVMVSTDYRGGDPSNPNDENAGSWTEIDVSPYPSGRNFDEVESPEISLKAFTGERVTFGFRCVHDGPHFIEWRLFWFKLFGSSNDFSLVGQPRILREAEVKNKDVIEPFQQVTLLNSKASWRGGSFSGQNYASIVSGVNEPSTSYLISPTFVIKDQKEVELYIDETLNNLPVDHAKILYSTTYDGGDPSKNNWIPLERTNKPEVEASYQNVLQGPYDFNDEALKNVPITFAFLYDSPENSMTKSIWQMNKVYFKGVGDDIAIMDTEIDKSKLPDPIEINTPVNETGGF